MNMVDLAIGLLGYLLVLQLMFPKSSILKSTFGFMGTIIGKIIGQLVEIAIKILTELVQLLIRLLEGFFGFLSKLFSRK